MMLFFGKPFYDIMQPNKTTNKTRGKRMKKLLNISVIAALAVLPMAANAATGDIVTVATPATATSQSQADNDVTATTPPKYALAVEAATDATNVATASYVKGAYNQAMKAINKVSETASNALTATGTATLTNKTIDADDNTIQDLETDNFKSGVVRDSTAGIRATASAEDDKLVTEKAIASALASATTGQVTETGTQTLTNKTIDADDNTISDLTTSNFKSGTLVNSTTGIADSSTASDSKLVSEKAIATALDDYATQAGVVNTLETATITGTVPTVTVWGLETTGTAAVTASVTSATYAEPAAQQQNP